MSRDETTVAREQRYIAPAEGEEFLRLAGHDRALAADDREESAHDRKAARRNRAESAAAAQRAVETLEAMSDGFFTLDLEGRITYLNAQTETFLARRREDLIGEVLWEAFPEVVGSRFGGEYRRAMREQVSVHFEERYEPLGRTFEARAYPVSDGLAVYFTDVTSERASEARLREEQRLAAIGRVTAGVAHDFNNLLTAIGGFAGLGQSTAVDETTRPASIRSHPRATRRGVDAAAAGLLTRAGALPDGRRPQRRRRRPSTGARPAGPGAHRARLRAVVAAGLGLR